MLSRVIITVAGAALLALASAVPAFADPWGSVDCTESPTPACELGVGGDGPSHHGGTPDQSPHRSVGDPDKSVRCSYVRSDYQPPATSVAAVAYRPRGGSGVARVQPAVFRRAEADPILGRPGAWYVYLCQGTGVIPAVYHPPVWIPDDWSGEAPSAMELSGQARDRLVLPSPRIEANPAGAQLVNLPTWLWLDGAGWGERSATVEVPGVSVTAVARPTSVTWSMGDGTSVTCPGPGTPFPVDGNPTAASPDCGHTYRSSSAGQPGETFPVTATVHWTVTWSGAGQDGKFPDLKTSTTRHFRVAEAQALGKSTG